MSISLGPAPTDAGQPQRGASLPQELTVPFFCSKTHADGPDDQSTRMLTMIGKLTLDDSQRDFIRDRWWDQITRMDATAKRRQKWHRTLRLVN